MTPNSKYLIHGMYSNRIIVLSLDTYEIVRSIPDYFIYCLTLTPDGKFIISGNLDGSIVIRNIETGEKENTLHGHASRISDVMIGDKGTKTVSCDYNYTVKIWGLESSTLLKSIDAAFRFKNWPIISAFGLSQDSEYIFTAGEDFIIQLVRD